MTRTAALVADRRDYQVAPASRLGTGWEAPVLLLLTLLALSFGVVSVYSASAVRAQLNGYPHYHYLVRQAAGGAIGLLLLVIGANIDYRRYRLLAWPLMLATILALAVLLVPGAEAIAPRINGAKRWLILGPINIQPSELAKFTLITWTAAMAVKKQDELHSLTRGLLPIVVVWLLVVGLIAVEPSLSAAMITLLLGLLVAFAAGARIVHFIGLGLLGLPALVTQIGSVQYRLERIWAFVDRSGDVTDLGYQINQALIALGSGGLFGQGFGRGQQKFGFLPEPHNDFILAMIGEEWGFAGVTAVVLVFLLLALVGYRIARQAPDLFGFLLAIGLTNLIALQAFLHIAVNLAVVPTTGVTLPFISYGRSSLLVSLFAVGVLINIARRQSAGRAS
jgi:cell division protein FtsW